VPKIEKPAIEKIAIDPTRQSKFFAEIAAMPVKEIAPVFVDPTKDYTKADLRDGVKVYYSKNPLNDLFTFTITIDIGTHHDDRLSLATQLLDKSGTKRFNTEELQKEWYKLGTAFGLGAGDNETTISISGLDENFDKSIRLLRELLDNPVATEETLAELKQIVFVQREDAKKDYRTISAALNQYNRYGKESTFLRALSNDAIAKLTTKELAEIIQGLLKYQHTIAYTGSRSLDNVLGVLKKDYPLAEKLTPPPPYKFLKVAAPQDTRIYFFDKEMAQAQVRLEFGDGTFDEANAAAVQLYNDYFAGGMSGIVFQELREARALAYSVGAVYSNGGRKGEQNVMIGVIGSQADKTPEALTAFLDLLDNLPKSPERFEESRDSILNRYRTSKLGFREVLGAVRSWEKLEVPVDPRKARFGQIEQSSLDNVLKFHANHLKGRPKLISIVGDKSKVNLEALKKHGEIVELKLEDIFSF
jgi:predicted Zn-dependent peptidase